MMLTAQKNLVDMPEFNNKMLSVSQLNEYIKALLDGIPFFSGLSVRGEISNFKKHYTGHMYFTLKDESSSIKAVMFRSDAARLGFIPNDGMKVIVSGRVSVFPRDGVYQIYANDIEPDGVGAMYYAYEQLKRKLEGEGLFSESRKRPLVKFPKKIGIVTSPTGAAVRDMINILGRRWPAGEIYIYPAQVQGVSAPGQLCDGVKFFNEKFKVDTIIIGRGGGSIEDLWAFNNEGLARAVAASHIPIISAIGHETDFTICDFAADLRAPTPSAAAELAVPDRSELVIRLEELAHRNSEALPRRIAEYRRRIESLASSRIMSDPVRLTADKTLAVERLAERLDAAVDKKTEKKGRDLGALAARLDALSPLGVLARGYSVVRVGEKVIRSTNDLVTGDRIELVFANGRADAEIVSIKQE